MSTPEDLLSTEANDPDLAPGSVTPGGGMRRRHVYGGPTHHTQRNQPTFSNGYQKLRTRNKEGVGKIE